MLAKDKLEATCKYFNEREQNGYFYFYRYDVEIFIARANRSNCELDKHRMMLTPEFINNDGVKLNMLVEQTRKFYTNSSDK